MGALSNAHESYAAGISRSDLSFLELPCIPLAGFMTEGFFFFVRVVRFWMWELGGLVALWG